jgi:RNA recognition motif-containing protein
MGLNRETMTPCGFCFVEFTTRSAAERAFRYVNKTRIDDRTVRVDWDSGFVEGRQLGRGTTGVQVRDEIAQVVDAGRTLVRPPQVQQQKQQQQVQVQKQQQQVQMQQVQQQQMQQ